MRASILAIAILLGTPVLAQEKVISEADLVEAADAAKEIKQLEANEVKDTSRFSISVATPGDFGSLGGKMQIVVKPGDANWAAVKAMVESAVAAKIAEKKAVLSAAGLKVEATKAE